MKDKLEIERIWLKLLSDQITAHRYKLMISQEEAPYRVGCEEKHFGRIERGEKIPSSLLLALIVLELQIDATLLNETFKERVAEYRGRNE